MPGDKSCEVRVGLVMYGGVSLAVYINGVAQEFFAAVKGRGLYKALKTLTDSDIVVDIISGSSAGGINGILLSYALCANKDFAQCSQLWRDIADVRKLLRSPFKDKDAPKSVMDSEVYYQEGVEDAFRNMRNYSPSCDEDPSFMQELDLFVTGTDMDGKISTQVDDAGHLIEVKNHRAVFQLKFREPRKNPFDTKKNPESVIALSKLCRITSCFPGAFAPVHVPHVSVDGKHPDSMSPDELLQYWGRLGREAYFIDGGVLDNKPFTHTVREIFYRTAEGRVDRKLFYVEPDPERFGEFQVRPPNFLKPIVDSLVSIPGYESIAEDLALLNSRNTHIRQYQRLFKQIESYRKQSPNIPPLAEPQKSVYDRARKATLSDRALRGLFKESSDDQLTDAEKGEAQRLVRSFDNWAGVSEKTLVDFDVYYRLRRLFHVVYSIYSALYLEKIATAEQTVIYRMVWQALNRHIKLLEIIASCMERVIDDADYNWSGKDAEDVWTSIRGSLEALLVNDGVIPAFPERFDSNWHAAWLQTHVLSGIHRNLNQKADRTIEQVPSLMPSADFSGILTETDDREDRLFRSLFSDQTDPICRAYREYIYVDAHLYPLEFISGLKEKDIIETVRISPLDAQKAFSNRKSADKVCGDSLAHFSAFFKRSWRSNDIMWGRLDAACQLTETLFTEKRLREVLAQEHLREKIRVEFFPSNTTSLIQRLFPHAGPKTQKDLDDWIKRLISPAWSAALENFDEMQELLIQVAQFEILHSELPEVHFDALREQAEWDSAKSERDSLLLNARSEESVRNWFGEMTVGDDHYDRPVQSKLGRYFEKYAVGKESLLKDVPALILLDTLARTLLILRNCLLGMFSDGRANRIRRNRFYLWAVDIPLKGFYGAIAFLRTAPSIQITIQTSLTAVSLLAIFVGIVWRGEIIETGGRFNFLWFAVFLAIPTIVLCTQALFFSRTRVRDRNFSPNTKTILVGTCTATPLLLIAAFWMGLLDSGRTLIENTIAGLGLTVRPAVVTILMYLVYVVAPLVLPVIGGWGAHALQKRRRISQKDVVFHLECLKYFQLRDVARMLNLESAVYDSPERVVLIDGILKKAKAERDWGRLKECIRKVNPDAFS